MNEDITKEPVEKFAQALKEEFQRHEMLDGGINHLDYLMLWKWIRLHDRQTILSLMAFAEMLGRTSDPLANFSEAMHLWLNEWHNTGRGEDAGNETEQNEVVH